MTESRPAQHFERLYQSSPDPWQFTTSSYEQAKYRATVDALEERRFVSGLEVGCSIGILTRRLAPRCDRLLGIDIVERPLADARARCADQPQVAFKQMQVPTEWPADKFDLIVFSEVLYFLSPADIDHCVRHVTDSLLPQGTVVLVNWLGHTDDPTPGNAAPDRFIATAQGALRMVRQVPDERYRLDLLIKS
jgi:2-polyprenyl-3-methyl-5-hydroxy-6-metoxy-1,4-benzoquinol methylase